MRGEVTARQSFDLEAEPAKALLCGVDLPVLSATKGAAAPV